MFVIKVKKIEIIDSYIVITTDKGRFNALCKCAKELNVFKIYTNTIVEHSQRSKFPLILSSKTEDMQVFRSLARSVREYVWNNLEGYTISFVGNPGDENDNRLPEFNDKCRLCL